MKKFTYKLLMCCLAIMAVISVSVFAYSDTPSTANNEIINTIKLLEIANGDQNGNMNFDKEVTRAEFVKMAINASKSKSIAANIKLNVSLFPDVKNSYWGAGYISVAITDGLVKGYIDGTFKPNNPVTLEEAATIVLRLLGYANSDLIGSYPSAQLQKYSDLGLDEKIYAERGDKLTREECMILLYNALSAKTKQGSVYCTTLGLGTNSEGKLDYSGLLEDKLDGPVIVTDAQNIFTSSNFKPDEVTAYYINNAQASASDIRPKDVVYYSEIINSVYAYRKTATGILDSSSSASVTISGKTYQIASASAKDKLSFGGKFNEEKAFLTLILGINDGVIDVEEGNLDKLNENEDNSSILSMIDKTISKAVYINTSEDAHNWETKIPFTTENAEIYLNGAKPSSVSVELNDVIYYSKAFKKIWIYRKTVSGNIEQISPVTSPTTVTVSGKSYSVATSDAAYDLSLYGAYEVGDKVTLVLGLNDECVAITDTKNVSGLLYGVVTAIGEKEYTDKNGEKYTADYVTVTDTKAEIHTYEFNNKYLSIGDAVKVSIADAVSITRLSADIGRSNAVSLSNAIREGKFSDNCEIIDVSGADVIKVKPERLTGTSIDYEQFLFSTVVLYYSYDNNGDISKLILKDFTGDIHEYGVVSSASGTRITYMTDKKEHTFSTEGNTCSIGPAKLKVENGTIVNAASLTGYIDNIDTLTNNAVYDKNDKEYLLSDDVKIFIKSATGYTYSSITEILSGNYELTAYYDTLPAYGGRIRVITALKRV